MSEQLDKLRVTLDELERELASLEEVDPQTREVLEQAHREIQAALDKRDASQIESESLIERLREAEQEFESSHPTLAGVIMRMVNSLAQLGI